MYHLNKIKNFLIFNFLLFLLPLYVDAIVKPTSEFYVNDYANILSNETEQYILEKSIKLNEVDGTQIVVVTIPTLEDNSLEDYAYKVFNSFEIGNREKDNGLLLLLALDERLFRVEVGNGLEGILPDGKTGRFQDQYIIPYLKDNKWDEGIKNGYDAFYSEIVKQNNLEINYIMPKNIEENSMTDSIYISVAIFLGIIMGILIKKIKKYNNIVTFSYIGAILLVLFIIMLLTNDSKEYMTSYIVYLIIHLITFLFIRFMTFKDLFSESSYNNRYSGGSSSRGGFSGGGGSSSGGGSSRGF